MWKTRASIEVDRCDMLSGEKKTDGRGRGGGGERGKKTRVDIKSGQLSRKK